MEEGRYGSYEGGQNIPWHFGGMAILKHKEFKAWDSSASTLLKVRRLPRATCLLLQRKV